MWKSLESFAVWLPIHSHHSTAEIQSEVLWERALTIHHVAVHARAGDVSHDTTSQQIQTHSVGVLVGHCTDKENENASSDVQGTWKTREDVRAERQYWMRVSGMSLQVLSAPSASQVDPGREGRQVPLPQEPRHARKTRRQRLKQRRTENRLEDIWLNSISTLDC